MKFEEYIGKTVFVTGAASGIGQAQALAFLDNGANVFAFDMHEGALQKLSILTKCFGIESWIPMSKVHIL